MSGGSDAALRQPTIVSIQPGQISSEGGEIVKIFGFSLDLVREPYVQFGSNDSVVASLVNSTEITCKSPKMLPRTLQEGYWVLVRITDLVTFWSNSIQLFVEPPPEVLSLSPFSGPSFGGTTISILGRNFLPTFSLVCLFSNDDGETRIPATWRSRNRVDCISPPWSIPNGTESVDVLVALLSGTRTGQETLLSYRFATPITVANVAVPNSDIPCIVERKMGLDHLDSIQTFTIKAVHSTNSSARYELLRVSGATTGGKESEAHEFFHEVDYPFSLMVGEGVMDLPVPLDTPGVLCTLPPWVKSNDAAVIPDDFVQWSGSGITGFNRGSSCDPAHHTFRCKTINT